MSLKKNERGKVIGTYEFFTIRQIPEYTGYGKDHRVKSTTIALYAGSKRLENDFASKDTAIEFAKSIKSTYVRRKNSYIRPKGVFFMKDVIALEELAKKEKEEESKE